MSNPIDARMMCLDAAIRTPGIRDINVVEQARKYNEFVLGSEETPKEAESEKTA